MYALNSCKYKILYLKIKKKKSQKGMGIFSSVSGQ